MWALIRALSSGVIFDAGRTDNLYRSEGREKGIEVVFSRTGEEADTIIKEIAEKYVHGKHDALTDNQEIEDIIKDIEEYAKQKDERIKELEAYVIDTDRILDSGIEIMPEFPHHERTKKLKSSI